MDRPHTDQNDTEDTNANGDGAIIDEGEAQCLVSIDIDPDAADDFCFGDGDFGAAAVVAPPEPPEVPAFLDNIRVEQITPEIQRRLQLALDLPSVSASLKNWEWLASHLGMAAEEITYIRERVHYPDSPTTVVLRHYPRESFGRILRIIRDSLRRYDVIIQLMPALYSFEEHLRLKPQAPEQTAAAAAACAPAKPSTVDSGIIESVQASNMTVSGSFTQSLAGPSNGRPLIVITFAEESPQHRKLVLWLCKNMENANAQVILDDTLGSAAADDWTARVNEVFSQAHAIVVVCSPSYFRCVDPAASLGEAPPLTDVHSQCSRFIYQLMCAEYRQNNCRNRRFRPLIFDTASGGVEIVPPILRNTVIHRWPRQHNEFMKLIFGSAQNS